MSSDDHLDTLHFSVVVTNHNHGSFVAQAIDSVLAQRWPVAQREVIVVDDGSTDDSRERLAAYAGREGVVIIEQPNRGQTAALAAGVERARGNVVCVLDSDDSCLPHKLEALAAHIGSLDVRENNLFLCHDLQIVDARSGAPIDETWFDVVSVKRFGALMAAGSVHHSFPFAVSSGLVFGRALLRDVLSRVPEWEWRYGADGLIAHVALLLTGEVHYVQQALGRYLVHGGNNFARIEQGRFHPRPVHDRWPRMLRFLELLLDSLPLGEADRAQRAAHLGRLEHMARAVPEGRRHAQPLLSFIVDATTASATCVEETAAAIAAQSQAHHETVWITRPGGTPGVPQAAGRVDVAPGADEYARLRAGLASARGGYVCFLEAGDRPERRFVERHLQAHRFGSLPMLTMSDLRLLDAQGAVLHAGILGTAAGWGSAASPQVSAFAHGLGDWQLAPLAACVLRRTALLDAFFAPEQPPVPGRLLGWLLAQYLVQVASATRLPENLMEIRLRADATPNPSWLARFVDRHGPLPAPNLPACAEALFARYAATAPAVRAYLSPAWEARFVQWLVQSAGADTPARLERAARASADAALIARVAAAVQAIGAASGAAVPGGPGGGANPAGRR